MNPAPQYGRPNKDVPQGEKPPSETGVISTKTKVRVDFLIATIPVFVALVALIFKVNAMTEAMKRSWTIADMAVWSNELQFDNPLMKVPKPIDTKKMTDPGFAHVTKPSPVAAIP